MRKLLALALVCFLALPLVAQKTAIREFPFPSFRKALELYEKKSYGAAQEYFNQTIAQIDNPNNETRINSEYYAALCALNLFNRDSEYLLKTFLENHPDSRWVEQVNFQLGTYNYRKKKYPETIQYLEEVNPRNLSKKEQTEYHFKLGYSYMMAGNKEKALTEFYGIKDIPSEYQDPTNYYYGHINYANGDYQAALKSLLLVKDKKGFDKIVPYYIVHIYHMQHKSDSLLAYALPLLENNDTERQGEIARLVGEAYYNKQEYKEALPYLVRFDDEAVNKTPEDNFQIGFCYLESDMPQKAVEYLNFAANTDNTLGQTANYQLGRAYLQMDNKTYARNAFKAASKMDNNKKIQEDAMFNYTKLSYELSYNPYHEAIAAFENFLNTYPSSIYKDEINELLIQVYLTTRNYKAALESLDKIQNKDFKLQGVYQFIAYNRGVELMISKNYDEALANFRNVKKYNIEPKTAALANFWMSEIYYQLGNYPKSVSMAEAFLKTSGAYASGKYDDAYYNLGYAHYKQNQINESLTAFRKYVTVTVGKEKRKVADAYLRIADCFFVNKSYLQAVEYYTKCLYVDEGENDYALLQRAMAKGFAKDDEGKIADLNTLISKYQDSKLIPQAYYEIGNASFKEGKNDQALLRFNELISRYPSSTYVKEAMLSKGLILYRLGEPDEALATFKKIAVLFPTYEDAREAIARAEDIYVELGRVNEYNTWAKSLTFVNITDAALDSVNYRSAENIYTKGDCAKSIEAFDGYLSKFNPAAFAVNAHFYLADCYYKQKDLKNALENYTFVADQPSNKFSEEALITAAYINYQNKNYDKSLGQYQKLSKIATTENGTYEASIGKMRCFNQLTKYDETIEAANKVIATENLPEKFLLEARVYKSRALIMRNQLEEADRVLEKIIASTKTEEAAEAYYNRAYIRFVQDKLDATEKMVFEAINMQPTYDYWLAKSFILLGDVYIKKNDFFQAKATFQSVVDNHDGEELNTLARKKLQDILDLETQMNTGEEKPIYIETGGESEEYQELYNDEKVSPKGTTTTK